VGRGVRRDASRPRARQAVFKVRPGAAADRRGDGPPPPEIGGADGGAASIAPPSPQSGTLMGVQPSPAPRFRRLVG